MTNKFEVHIDKHGTYGCQRTGDDRRLKKTIGWVAKEEQIGSNSKVNRDTCR